MGAIFAFGFAVFIGIIGCAVFLPLRIIFKKRSKIISVAASVLLCVCFIPLAFFAVLIILGLFSQSKMKMDYSKTNGKLFAEIIYGNKNSVYRQVLKNEDFNIHNDSGETPLIYIISTRDESYSKVIKKMLEKGADPDFKDAEGNTPLLAAVSGYSWGSSECVRLLIEHGASVNIKDKNGNTPLLKCLEETKFHLKASIEIVKILVSSGCDVHEKNNNGEDALQVLERLIQAEKEHYKDFPQTDITETEPYKTYNVLYAYLKEL